VIGRSGVDADSGCAFCVSCLNVPSGDVVSCDGVALVGSAGLMTELPTEPFWHEGQLESAIPQLPPVAGISVPHTVSHAVPHTDAHGFE